MEDIKVSQEINSIVSQIECGRKLTEIMHSSWLTFTAFLRDAGFEPDSVKNIDKTTFGPFANHCIASMEGKNAIMTLAALRFILIQSGFPPKNLAELTVPAKSVHETHRRRRRTQNSAPTNISRPGVDERLMYHGKKY